MIQDKTLAGVRRRAKPERVDKREVVEVIVTKGRRKGGRITEIVTAGVHPHGKIAADNFTHFRLTLRKASQDARITIEREGVGYRVVRELPGKLDIQPNVMLKILGLAKSTFTKKIRQRENVAGMQGLSVVGLADLVNMAEDMLKNADIPEDFNVEAWVGDWLQDPQPALGGSAPAEMMDTPSGRESVRRLLASIQSGAYQ